MYVVVQWNNNNTMVQTSSRCRPIPCSKDVLVAFVRRRDLCQMPVYPNEGTESRRSGLTSGSEALPVQKQQHSGVDVYVVQYSRQIWGMLVQHNTRNAWCFRFRKYTLALYDRSRAPLELKFWMLRAKVFKTTVYGCVTWSPRA